MDLSDIPLWIYGVALWYAFGIYTIGAMFAAMVYDGESLPTKGRCWIWIVALAGSLLFFYVLIWRREDFTKGFVLTDRAAKRLKNTLQRK